MLKFFFRQHRQLAGQLGGRPAVSKSEPVDKLVARIEGLIGR